MKTSQDLTHEFPLWRAFRVATTALGVVAAFAAGSALAAPGEDETEQTATTDPKVAAAPGGATAVDAPGQVTTATAASATAADDETAKAWSVSLTAEASVGIGTFVSEPQRNEMVTTAFSLSGSYSLSDKVSVGAGVGLTWYQALDFGTSLSEHEVLLSDIYLGIGHSGIYHHDDSGFNLAGAFRLYLPTSLASQFQNRLFTIRPTLTASIPVGPVAFSYTLGFGKYFNQTAVPTVDCGDFENSAECIEGRENNPEFGFESERRGAEVFLPGGGTNSFYVLNSVGVGWTIVEGLQLSLGVTLYNTFGVRSFEQDEFSGEHATSGRSQTDRLITQLGLGYQIIKQLSVGLSLVTDTVRPFGEDGNDFVVFDFERAPDNITSLNLSVTGTL